MTSDPKKTVYDSDSGRTRIEQVLAHTPGILSVDEIRSFPSPVMDLFRDDPYIMLHSFAAYRDYENEVKWIKQILSIEKVSGPFYLMYEGATAPLWAKVNLSTTYEWVESLWNLGHGLYFMPTDVSYFLDVSREEGITEVSIQGKRT